MMVISSKMNSQLPWYHQKKKLVSLYWNSRSFKLRIDHRSFEKIEENKNKFAVKRKRN